MHISGELQAIMTAVMKGLRSFVWTVIFLMLLVYAVSVFITQTVTDYKISHWVQTRYAGGVKVWSAASCWMRSWETTLDPWEVP